MSELTIKNPFRMDKIIVKDGTITYKRFLKGEVTYRVKDIVSVQTKRSVYDVPGAQTSLFIGFANGKTLKIKGIRITDAELLKKTLLEETESKAA